MKQMTGMVLAALAAFSGLAAETVWVGGASGDWHVAGNWSEGIPDSAGDVAYITMPAAISISEDTEIRTLIVNAAAVVTVGADAELSLSNSGGPVIEATDNLILNGAGTVRLSLGPWGDYADIRPVGGRTIRIDAKIVSEGGLENNHAGTVTVTHPGNDFPGDVALTYPGGVIEFSDVGALGHGANLIGYNRWPHFRYTGGDATLAHNILIHTPAGDGRDSTFQHAGTGTLTFTGNLSSGNEVEKAICFQVDRADTVIVMDGNVLDGPGKVWYIKNGAGTLINNGVLAHSGETHTRDSGTFVLANTAAAAGNAVSIGGLSTYVLADGAVMGNGNVTIESNDSALPAGSLLVRGTSQTGTGALVVQRGALLSVDGGATLNNAVMHMDTCTTQLPIKPTRVILNADNAAAWAQTIPDATVWSDGPMVFDLKPAASGAGTLTLGSLAVPDGASIEFVAPAIGTAATRIFIGNLADGPLPANITVNGLPAAYDSQGDGLLPLPPTTADYAALPVAGIPVSGAVITDTAAAATINQSGSGGDLTITGATTVGALVQNYGAEPASVALGGATLTTPILAVAPGGNALAFANGTITAPGGTSALTLDNRSAGAPLTVAATIADNGAALALVKAGIGYASVTSPQYTGDTAILGGALAVDIPTGASQAFGALSGAGATAFVKTGGGTLDLTAPSAFAGEIIVSNGTLRAGVNGALGSTTAGTTILPGGQLDIGGATHTHEWITFAGDGPDGSGAIVSTELNYNSLMNGRLAADASVGTYDVRWDDDQAARVDFRGGTFDFAGHTLSKIGDGEFGFTWMKLLGITSTTAIDIKEGIFITEAGTDFQGSPDNTVTIWDGATLDVYDWMCPLQWTVRVPEASDSTLRVRWGGTDRNHFAGPVEVPASSSLTVSHVGWCCSTFRTPITGGGRFSRVSGQGETYLFATNDVSSVTAAAGGIHAAHPGSLGPYALTTDGAVSNHAWLYMYTGEGHGTWTPADITALAERADYPPYSTFSVWSKDGSAPLDFADDFTRPADWRFRGNVSRTFTGALTHGANHVNGAVIIEGGTAVFSNDTSPQYPGHLYVRENGAALFTNAAPVEYVMRDNADIIVGDGSSLTLGGNTSMRGPFRYREWSGPLIGQGKSTVTVRDNASLFAHLYLGDAAEASTALYLDGGLLDSYGGWGNDARIGVNGYGYIEQNAGEFKNHGYTQLGYNSGSVGFIRVNGGLMTMTGGEFGPESDFWEGRIELSRGGTGIMQLAGDARFECATNVLDIGSSSEANDRSGGLSVFTVQDSAYADIGWIDLGLRHNHFSAVNLNGGVLRTGYFNRWTDMENSTAHINFNGGTLRANQSEAGGLLRATPQQVYIWPRGATIDTDVYDTFIASPLLAPGGKGVEAIPLASGGNGYNAPPHVSITGGGGIGATAVAWIDRARGVVTNIAVTSPGVGYTSAPEVNLSGGGGGGAWCGAPVMRVNSSGGLTKLGAGSLHLQTANTYTGPTVIREGTLFIEADGALPEDSSVVIEAGATLDLGGRTVTVPSVTLNGGTVANGTLLTSAFEKSGDGTATLGGNVGFLAPGADAAKRVTPGLWEGRLPGERNVADPVPHERITLGTDQANSTYDFYSPTGDGTWPLNVTQCYEGYIWNRDKTDVTWTLYKNFDDTIDLYIDGALVPVLTANEWHKIGIMDITLTPGPHAIDIRFGQGAGGAGPTDTDFAEGDTLGWPTDIALGIDFEGRGEKIMGNFVKFEDPGDGSLLTIDIGGWQGFEYAPNIVVDDGILRLPEARPGLYEGMLAGARNTNGLNPKTAVRLTTEKAHVTTGWDENTTAVYTGVIWNRTGGNATWTFAKNFDDTFDIWIDGVNLAPDEQEWNEISLATATLTPGPHDFEVRFGQGIGGAGPATPGWECLGFGIDFGGNGTADRARFIRAADAGDGLLFTTERPDGTYVNDLNGATVHVKAGAVFDGSGTIVTNVTFTGEGTIRNLTLAANTVISPAGDEAIGSLTLSGVTFGAGSTYRVNVSGTETADTITSAGSLNLTNLTVVPADTPSADPEGKEYIIAHADGGFTGVKPALSGFASKWKLLIKGNDLILTTAGGTMLLLH